MSGPKFANFSRVKGTVRDTLDRIAQHVCHPWNCELTDAAFLTRSGNNYEVDGDQIRVEDGNVDEFIESKSPFGVTYAVFDARAELGIAFTDIGDDGHTVTVELDSALVYFDNGDYPDRGRWFQGLLTSLTVAMGAEVCSALDTLVLKDKDIGIAELTAMLQRPRYLPVEPEDVLARLRTGDLLTLPGPVFHAWSVPLIDTAEIRQLLGRSEVPAATGYSQAPGYHIIANIASGSE